MNSITVEAQRDDDGKIKHLKFNGTYVEPPAPEEPEEPVGVGASEAPAANDESGGEESEEE